MLLQNRGIVYLILDNVEFETQSRSSIEGLRIKFIKNRRWIEIIIPIRDSALKSLPQGTCFVPI